MLIRPFFTVLGALLIALPTSLFAADPVWSAHTENDWIGGTDQNYTASVKFSRSAEISPERWLPRLLGAKPGEDTFFQVGVGQQIYTPDDRLTREPLFDQHPFAAWLYLEGVIVMDRGEGRPIDQVRVQVGTVGPSAQGERAQDWVHSIITGVDFRGWDNQIGNQPGLLINYDRRWTGMRFGDERWGGDLVPHLGATVGNVYTSANAGATLRFGRHLDRPFGAPRNEPGSGSLAWFEPAARGERPIYGFLGAEARAVAHAIWLDGRPFADDLVTQESEPFVYDFEGGVVLPVPYLDARLTASYIRRTQTFEKQIEPRAFGTLTMSVRF